MCIRDSTGSERNGLRSAIHQHLGAGYGTLAGTAAAAHEADDLTFTERFETSLSFGRRDKIRRAGAQILSLLTADDKMCIRDRATTGPSPPFLTHTVYDPT